MADMGGTSNGLPVALTVGVGIASAVVSSILTWFGNVLVMREKFISKGECAQCQKVAEREGQLEIKALETKIGSFESWQCRMEDTVGKIGDQSVKSFGMISEIHGHLFGPSNGSKGEN